MKKKLILLKRKGITLSTRINVLKEVHEEIKKIAVKKSTLHLLDNHIKDIIDAKGQWEFLSENKPLCTMSDIEIGSLSDIIFYSEWYATEIKRNLK